MIEPDPPDRAAELAFPEEVRRRRLAAGLSQTELANQVGYSREYVSRAERTSKGLASAELACAIDNALGAGGCLVALHSAAREARKARRNRTISPVAASQATSGVAELTRVLKVEPDELVINPFFREDKPDDDNDAIPAVRDVLLTSRRLSSRIFSSPKASWASAVSPDRAAQLVEKSWWAYQQGRIGRVIAELSVLIGVGQDLEDGGNRQGWAISARVHHLAATTLSKVGEVDLAWIAAERSMQAADRADDPLVLASAARAGTHALIVSGRFDDAVELGNTAAEWLRGKLDDRDPAALSLLGMLRLRTAVAAARRQDRNAAEDLIVEAQRAADRLGRDANYWQTGFGPTNVEIHRISMLLDLGHVEYVANHGVDVAVKNLPVERRVSHLIDVARALSMMARDGEAVELLLRAEQSAPHMVQRSPAVRETVKAVYRRSPASGLFSPIGALAERCHAIR